MVNFSLEHKETSCDYKTVSKIKEKIALHKENTGIGNILFDI